PSKRTVTGELAGAGGLAGAVFTRIFAFGAQIDRRTAGISFVSIRTLAGVFTRAASIDAAAAVLAGIILATGYGLVAVDTAPVVITFAAVRAYAGTRTFAVGAGVIVTC